ncbi:efflux RND transporter periplasmic adaptor subunit [Dongshaea marina]|uniref:efflux RND transporter periplasmic adaptor subunit n=1 Tax=Dongshaea marina TaxID=2047966 RepID=UPI000D3EC515|nr:efflux RND transporter periplasmic adaptor subunit [Dongshaea marina]
MRKLYQGLLLSICALPLCAEELPAMDCVLLPQHEIDLSSPVSGVISSILVERGQEVKAGDVVALLDARVEKATVELAQARAKIESEVEIGQANLSYDRRSQQRFSRLFQRKLVSEHDKEQSDRDVDLSSGALKQAVELQQIRQLELKRSMAQLAQKTLTSPIDGVIHRRLKSVGEYVEEQPVVRIVNLDVLKVETIVPMRFYGQIKPGMQAQVHPENSNSEPLYARVSSVDRIGDVGSGSFGVHLILPNPEHRIPAGVKCALQFSPQTNSHDVEQTTYYGDGRLPETVSIYQQILKLGPGILSVKG